MNSKKPILMVEDDKIDSMTIQRAMNEIKIVNKLIIKQNGEEALKYLKDPESEVPCIILLDLNMPRMNGIEFLRHIKNDDSLKMIPVVVLTTSRDDTDRLETFGLGIAGYMVKPVDYYQFVEVVKTIDLYWTLSVFPFDEVVK